MLAVLEKEVDQSSALMQMIHKEYPQYHPVMSMVRLAHLEGVTPELQFQCHKAVASYILPTLKSVEVRVDQKKKRMVTVSLFDDDIQEGQLVEESTMEVGMTMVGEVIEGEQVSDGF